VIDLSFPVASSVAISFTLLVLESSPSLPELILPLSHFYAHLPLRFSPTLSCPGSAPVRISRLHWLCYPTTDPALAWLNPLLLVLDVWKQPLQGNILSFN